MQIEIFTLSLHLKTTTDIRMEQKTVTLRLPQDMADYITRNGDGMTDGVKDIIGTLQRHERYADMELRGRFSADEWKFLADSLNGTMTLDDFRFMADVLVSHNEESQLYDKTADKWNIDLADLNRKCAALTATQTEALYRRIEKFWVHPEADLDMWAQY